MQDFSPADTIAGDPRVTDAIDVAGTRVRLRRHVLTFFQGNRYLLSDLVAHVIGLVEEGGTVVDLYAGAGLLAVGAAARARRARHRRRRR